MPRVPARSAYRIGSGDAPVGLWASSLAVLSVSLSLLRGFGSDDMSVADTLAITVVMPAGLWLFGTGLMVLILAARYFFTGR